MFREACKKARAFTKPLLTVFRHIDGRVVHGAASLVIVNGDGWFLTAAHIFDPLAKAQADAPSIQEHLAKRENIERNPALDGKHKRKQIAKLPFDPNWVESVSFFWMDGRAPAQPLAMHVLHASPPHDLALGRIANFDPAVIDNFPVFRSRDLEVDAGVSLCRMGFPFARTRVDVDPAARTVELNVEEISYFPNEAMLTRQIGDPNVPPGVEPGPLFIETSTPGLRGQSGGPIFDQNGDIWGIQSYTAHVSLGFDPPDPSNPQRTVHQFLNTGVGVHPIVLDWFMRKHGVNFAVE